MKDMKDINNREKFETMDKYMKDMVNLHVLEGYKYAKGSFKEIAASDDDLQKTINKFKKYQAGEKTLSEEDMSMFKALEQKGMMDLIKKSLTQAAGKRADRQEQYYLIAKSSLSTGRDEILKKSLKGIGNIKTKEEAQDVLKQINYGKKSRLEFVRATEDIIDNLKIGNIEKVLDIAYPEFAGTGKLPEGRDVTQRLSKIFGAAFAIGDKDTRQRILKFRESLDEQDDKETKDKAAGKRLNDGLNKVVQEQKEVADAIAKATNSFADEAKILLRQQKDLISSVNKLTTTIASGKEKITYTG